MTSPKVATFSKGSSRYYIHPTTADKVPGVTSVLNMMPKPFLKPWGEKLVATEAVEGLKNWLPLAERSPQAAIDYLKTTPKRSTQGAADIGTAAHGIFEALAKGESLGQITPDLQPFADHYADFLAEVQPEFLALEDTVWSEKHAYAGSFDALARIQGRLAWIDNKTTKSGVYPEVALQLSAYANADYILTEEGEQHHLPNEDTQHGLVVHVRPEGWALYEVPIGPEIFEVFLNLRSIFTWDSISRSIVGKPVLKGAAK